MTGDLLGVVDVILECLKEAYASGHGPLILEAARLSSSSPSSALH
jgi:hypothetical protein